MSPALVDHPFGNRRDLPTSITQSHVGWLNFSALRTASESCGLRCASTKRPSTRGSCASSDHAVGEGQLCAAPTTREAPRVAVCARLIPVAFAPQEEDD